MYLCWVLVFMVSRRQLLQGVCASSVLSLTGCLGSLDNSIDSEWEFENLPYNSIIAEGKLFDGEKAVSVVNFSGETGYFALPQWMDVQSVEEENQDISSYEMSDTYQWFVETGTYSVEEWRDYFSENNMDGFSENSVIHSVDSFSLPLTISFYQINGEFKLESAGSATCLEIE